MGVFRKLGRRVEQFKSEAETAAGENAPFRCEACGARFDEDHERCPDCGAEGTVALDD